MAALMLHLLVLVTTVLAENPYSSNVVALTPRNMKELERSPQLWAVNICRNS